VKRRYESLYHFGSHNCLYFNIIYAIQYLILFFVQEKCLQGSQRPSTYREHQNRKNAEFGEGSLPDAARQLYFSTKVELFV
jgi:hypothetical protein